ncbi:NAD-dependent epimerase/dehydratase family protein [Leptolyngbya sp. 15MV]|nr:NAD-dependent epimerase/dehydratase family protein [Leptolyngbya sp. 15MV]
MFLCTLGQCNNAAERVGVERGVKKVLVTGCAGFIGSRVARELTRRGVEVVGVDTFDPFYDPRLKRENLADVELASLHEADITDEAAMQRVFEGARPEAVVHLAAKAGVRPSLADPVGYARTNVVGTQVVLSACARAGVGRVVVASSSSVYGNNRKTPFAESDAVEEPVSPYAATKRASELLAFTHWSATRIPTACLRFFTVYGPRQRPDLAIMGFMRRIAVGEPITMFGDGSMAREFPYSDDIVSGVLAALERVESHGFRIWNLGSDRPVRLDALIDAVARTVGRSPTVERRPTPPGDVERTWADLTRSRAELGYAPGVALEEGLARQWAWLRPRLG